MTSDELIHMVRLGGITMACILGASVVSLFVAIERLIALWGVGAQARALGQAIAQNLLRGDIAAARSAAERSTSVTADIFRAGFQRAAKTTGPSLDAAVDRVRQETALKLKSKMWVLGTIGAVTPFVGLFGTVAGIMRSFKDLGVDVESGGSGGSAAVMTGISEALVATAAGIIVAVEAVIFYNYFQSRLSKLSVELKLISEEFVELLRERAVNGVVPSTGSNGESPKALPSATEAAPGAPATATPMRGA